MIDPIISNLSDEEISQELTLTTSSSQAASPEWTSATRWLVPRQGHEEKVNKQIEAADEVMNQGADLSNLLVGADPFQALDF